MPSLMPRGIMTPEEAGAFSGVFHAHRLDRLSDTQIGGMFREVAERCDPLKDFIVADRGDETYLIMWGVWYAARRNPKWGVPVRYGEGGMECTIVTPCGSAKISAERTETSTYDDLKAEILRKVAEVWRPALWRLVFPLDGGELPSVPTEVRAAKIVVANGGGLAVNVTKEARLLGLGRGDAVEIVMRRL